MTSLLFVARGVHLAQCVLLVGAFGLLLMAGPPESAVMRKWERCVRRGIGVALAVALASGVLVLAAQAAAFEDRPGAALEPGAILRAMLDTRSGVLWTARMGLLVVLAAFVVLGGEVRTRADEQAARVETFGLSALALVIGGAASHAAAGSPGFWPAGADMAHLVAAGLWAGGLPPLALLLFVASRRQPALDPAAVRTMLRFSHLALVCVLVLAGSGAASAWLVIGSPEALLGTTHGRLLLTKLALLFPALLLAASSRAALRDLSDPNPSGALTTARRMALFIAVEAVLVLAVIGFAAAMSVTTPAIHAEIVWPLPFRLSLDPWPFIPRLAEPVSLAALAMAGLAIAVAARLARRRPALLAGTTLALLAALVAIGLRPLVVYATPASFARPSAPYSVGSIAEGRRIFEAECATCHAETGGAVPLAGEAASRPPGDLFWEITKGTTNMPAFAPRLSDAQRWSLVHYLRALGLAGLSGSAQTRIGPETTPDGAWLASPDFRVAVGPLEPGSLSDFRGRKLVLLVLYDLPASRARMSELARRYGALSVLGVEVVAVPPRSSEDAIADLGQSPPALFPVVTEGVEEIVAAYRMFAPVGAHAEFLIDRAGYVRAIWRSDGSDMPDASAIQSQVERLNSEKAPPPLPDDHIH